MASFYNHYQITRKINAGSSRRTQAAPLTLAIQFSSRSAPTRRFQTQFNAFQTLCLLSTAKSVEDQKAAPQIKGDSSKKGLKTANIIHTNMLFQATARNRTL